MGKALLRSYWTDREPKKYNSELHKQSCSWNMVPAGKNYLFAAIAQALHSQWWLAQSPEALWIILECFLSWGLGFGKACGSELKLIWNQCVSCTNTYVCICIYLCIWACVYKCWIYICSAVLRHGANTGSGTVFSFLWLAALLWWSRIKCHRLRLSQTSLSELFLFISFAFFHLLPFAFCSVSQRSTIEGIRITIDPPSPRHRNLDKGFSFNESL